MHSLCPIYFKPSITGVCDPLRPPHTLHSSQSESDLLDGTTLPLNNVAPWQAFIKTTFPDEYVTAVSLVFQGMQSRDFQSRPSFAFVHVVAKDETQQVLNNQNYLVR